MGLYEQCSKMRIRVFKLSKTGSLIGWGGNGIRVDIGILILN